MNNIAEKAISYRGQREKTGNQGFLDAAFEKLMRSVGFYTGAAWCLFFCRLIWKLCGQDISLIKPSAIQTMKAASAAGNWHTTPVVGAIAIYRSFKNGKPQSTGHGALVTAVYEGGYDTEDGNTTDKGGREGIMVAPRKRHLNAESWTKEDGLRLMGFVHPTQAA